MVSLGHHCKLNLGTTVKPKLPLQPQTPPHPLGHLIPDASASLLLHHAKHGPTSGPLHLLLPPPRLLLPQMFSGFTPSLLSEFCPTGVFSENRSKPSANEHTLPHPPDTPCSSNLSISLTPDSQHLYFCASLSASPMKSGTTSAQLSAASLVPRTVCGI